VTRQAVHKKHAKRLIAHRRHVEETIMISRLAASARTILKQAEKDAETAGSPTVEAEHLLLASASAPGTEAPRVLASAGLNHLATKQAVDREVPSVPRPGWSCRLPGCRRSVVIPRLGFAGVPPANWCSSWCHSALKAACQRQIRPGHLLLGVLSPAGTVPRALTVDGMDRAALTARTRQPLADDEG
jgi:D-alanyl-D-alanine carboxypeptidase